MQNLTDEEWKVNQQKTTEFRQRVFGILMQKTPGINQQLVVEVEKRCFMESNTKNEYTQKIQLYHRNLQQQQMQQQQQQQSMQQGQQQPQIIGMQHQQPSQYQQQSVQQQQQQQQQQGNLNAPKNVINLSSLTPQQQQQIKMQQQQQQQAQIGQQVIRPNLPQQQQQQFAQQQTISQNQQPPNFIQNQMPTPSTIPPQNVIITNLNQQNQPKIRPSMPQAYIQPPQTQQQQQQPPQVQPQPTLQQPTVSLEEEELYNRKIQELKINHLARLERMYQNSSGRNPNETTKIKAFIDVVMGHKRVTMDVLLKCEASLNNQRALQQQQQQLQQQQLQQQQQQAQQRQLTQPIPQAQQQIPQKLAQQQPQPSTPQPQLQQKIPPQVSPVNQSTIIKPPIEQIPQTTTPKIIQQPQIVQQPINIFKQFSLSIEACNNSNPVHKSNVRYLIDSIKNSIDGSPPIKMFKIDNELRGGDGGGKQRKPLVNLRDGGGKQRKPLVNLRDSLTLHKNILNENIPKKLLIELAGLSNEKFRIEVKSKYEIIILPVHDKLSRVQGIKIENNEQESEQDIQIENKIQQSSPLENYYVTLKCVIVNKSLALVPPIRIFVPYNYPEQNPLVDCVQLPEFDDDMLPEYNTLGILRRINKQFQINYLRLSERYSVTQLLDAWYSSVESL